MNKKILNTDGFNKDVFNWQSEYRSITFNQFGKEFPLGGMNEQGLVIEELNMSSVTLIPDSTKQLINEFQLVQYLLDKCKSVDDVVRELKKFQCKPLFQSLHYLIADHSGDVIIAEFNGSDFNIYFSDKTGFPVLSNNNYTESLKYLSYFQGFGGELPVKNRQGSNERFVSVSNLLAKYKDQPPVSYSFQILETVKQIDTRWSLVYDIENLRVSLKFHSCETLKVFDFKNLLELESISGLGGNLANCNFVGDDKINAVTTDENFILIQTVFSQYANLEKSDINYNLLNQMSLLGNRNLKGITNEE
ncbi:MAG: linear amide C-N hydrolase [Bacteroidales bacterium]|nr:linear amide C-N hydrolase [Bacteroidales bacterium]